MNKKEAEQLLEEVFHNSFDEKRYWEFITEFFNGKIDIDKKPAIWANSTFKDYIAGSKCLGTYRDTNKKIIAIVTVELKKMSSVEKARTIQRNFIANYLNKSGLDAAIIAFYGDDGDDWRLSFVKLEYKNVNSGGKLKSETELTPVKRYSYLVGKHEANHTCKSQLSPILQDDQLDTTLEEIEKAFSVDKVTKEFFDKYKELFFRLNDSLTELMKEDKKIQKEFEEKDIKPDAFSKKLLGQIVFLFFLQKKGWMGIQKDKEGDFENWGAGPKDFLQKLYAKKYLDYSNFFNDILEPLFYEALAKDRRDNSNYYSKLKCKIPFLNGGLFEPINDYSWEKTDILINNDIFKEILDVFSQYNFTVKEDEPLEKEVAVDPEMLGKVFENLLDIRDRKSKGSYYTPREIVHYMCQQSLINYLETNLEAEKVPKEDIESFILNGDLTLAELIKEQEEKKQGITYATSRKNYELSDSIKKNFKKIDLLLKEVKIADPAVGSGAFPVGMMNEIVKARSILSVFFTKKEQEERTNYHLKREAIENSLYGVDIDPSAVEISKLRFWLSLIVDEEDIDNIKPLPNLDNKIMCGNSLLDSFEGVTLYTKSNKDNLYQKKLFDNKSDILFKKLQKLQKEYFNEEDRLKKKAIFKQIEYIEWGFIEEKLKEQKSKDAIDKLQQIKRSKSKPFFIWELYFGDVFNRENPGFDIIIGNPPYIQLQKDGGFLANQLSNCNFKTFERTGDIYVLFYEKGCNLLKNNGFLCYITSNKWMRAGYGSKLREYFSKLNPLILIDLGQNIFETPTVDTNILLIKKQKFDSKLNAVTLNELNVTKKLEKKNLEYLVKYNSINLNNIGKDAWFIGNALQQKLKSKIERIGTPLQNWDIRICRGILTGLNSAFLIDTKTKDKLCTEDPKSIEIIKPIVRGKDIKKYHLNWAGLWIIYTYNGVKINDYPSIKKHLLSYKSELEKRTGGAKRDKDWNIVDIPYKWYELQVDYFNSGVYKDFEKEKLIYSEIVKNPQFCIDNSGIYCEATSFFITGNNIKLLCGLLNSKPVTFFFKTYYSGGGLGDAGIRYKKKFLMDLPIPQKNPNNKLICEEITNVVDKIVTCSPQNIKKLEEKINLLVYKLYELTPEEIKIVEGGKN